MNANEIRSLNRYLIENGVLNIEDKGWLREETISHKGFIVGLAKMMQLKSKDRRDRQRMGVGIYARYINGDNVKLVKLFKRIMMIYQRSLRRNYVKCYLNWKLLCQTYTIHSYNQSAFINAYIHNEDGGEYEHEHFDFSINKPTVHERLFNDYKQMQYSKQIQAMNHHASEAKKCPFIPIVNHDYMSNQRQESINKTIDVNIAQFDSIEAQGSIINNSNSSTNITSHRNKIPHSHTHSHRNNTSSNSIITNTTRLNPAIPYPNKTISLTKGGKSYDSLQADSNRLAHATTCPNTDRFSSNTNNASTIKTHRSIIPYNKQQYQYQRPYKQSSSSLTNAKSASSKNLNLKRHTPYEKLLITNNKNTMTTIQHQDSSIINQSRPDLTNQSSYNSLIIQTPNFNPTTIPIPFPSNRSAKMQKTPKYSKGKAEKAAESTTRDTIGQDLSESLYLRYPKRNYEKHLSLKSYDNSTQMNLQEKVTTYISNENKSKQVSPSESCLYNNGVNVGVKCVKKKDLFSNGNNNDVNAMNYKEIKITKKVHPKIIEKLNDSNANHQGYYAENEESIEQRHHHPQTQQEVQPQGNTAKKKTFEPKTKPIMNNTTLKISSKVIHEKFNDYPQEDHTAIKSHQFNSIYSNQITLQTINDSKLYEIANHYITTDESLDRYKCMSNYNTHRNVIHK